jgi:L-threonylcarbamoyladenylate synthase
LAAVCFDTKNVSLIDAFDPSALDKAADALNRDGLVVVPTDTVYGIAARLDRPRALDLLFDTKGRPREFPIAVLVARFEEARSVGIFDERASRLAKALWPGPLTLVVPRASGFETSLGGDSLTVGIRVPDHPVALRLIERCGPLATTSANLSGADTPATAQAIEEVFGEAVSVYLDVGSLSSLPSSVVSVVGGDLKVLRQGALPEAEISAAWNARGR